MAADAGDVNGCFQLGLELSKRKDHTAKGARKAQHYLALAAKQGHEGAQFALDKFSEQLAGAPVEDDAAGNLDSDGDEGDGGERDLPTAHERAIKTASEDTKKHNAKAVARFRQLHSEEEADRFAQILEERLETSKLIAVG